VSDELIEAMARELSKHLWVVVNGDDDCGDWEEMPEMVQTSYKMVARALLPVIRAHLEPTSEMLANTVTSDGRMRIMEFTTIEERGEAFMVPRYIWRAMLAASPIGDVG